VDHRAAVFAVPEDEFTVRLNPCWANGVIYETYGLRLRLPVAIPGLGAASSTGDVPDIEVHWGIEPRIAPGLHWVRSFASDERDLAGTPTSVVDRCVDGGLLRVAYADGTTFWLKADTTQIWASWPDSTTSEDASTYFVGPILGYVLRLRGLTVLHASAVRTSRGAVALVGPQGAGKSSMAAAMVGRGHAILSEDVCALRGSGGTIEVLPGYPLIRLWPEAVEMLFGQPDALPLLTPTWDKRYLPLATDGQEFCGEPVPLCAVLLLGKRESERAPRLELVPAAEAMVTLVANTYKNLLLDGQQRADEFRFLQRLMQSVPVGRLVGHSSGERIGEMCDLVLDACAGALETLDHPGNGSL
jgi:hypothetical protein